MIRIEILYPDAACLYGDLQNVHYLARSCPDTEIVEDKLWEEPHFVKQTPNLLYMGSTTEQGQRLIIENLRPYRQKLGQMIADGVYFLVTGNALEIFGQSITDADGSCIEALGLLPTAAKRDMLKRYNALYLGRFEVGEEPMHIVGIKSQFGHSYWQTGEIQPWFFTERGDGLNPKTEPEGIRVKNFLASYLIGPLLILNPPLTKWLLGELGVSDPSPAFESAAMAAYEARVREYSDPKRSMYYDPGWLAPEQGK